MKWRAEIIPNPKLNTFNFIENEKLNTELEHECNVGKINQKFYLKGQNEEFVSENQQNVTSSFPRPEDNNEDEKKIHISRLRPTIPPGHADAPQLYKTTCFFKPTIVPYWYRESMTIKMNSTKRIFKESVLFTTKLQPVSWRESTVIKMKPRFICELHIPINEDVHYMSLEPQQKAVSRT